MVYHMEVTKKGTPMTDKPMHQVIREMMEAAGSTFMTVGFNKKDGSPRQVTFNPRDFNEIKGTGKPSVNPNLFRIREMHNKEEGKTTWRSFDATRVTWIKFKGQTIIFKNK